MLRARLDSSIDQVAFESCIRYSKQEYESTVRGKSSGKRKKKEIAVRLRRVHSMNRSTRNEST